MFASEITFEPAPCLLLPPITWYYELYDTPTRIYISAIIFSSTLLISFVVGDEAALGYLVFTLLIPERPLTWFRPVLDLVDPYLAEQPPARVRHFLHALGIPN